MRLPSKKRPGNPILAKDWNLLIDALEARTPRQGPGLELVWSSGGFAYRSRKTASGAESSSCGNLAVYTKVPDGAEEPNLYVGVGQAGSTIFEETDLGGYESNYGNKIVVKVTLNGTDGTYTSEIIALAEVPEATDTVVHFLLASVGDEGGISQHACGPVNITVCRNWFANEAPFYGISVS